MRQAGRLIQDKVIEMTCRYPTGTIVGSSSCSYVVQANGEWRKIQAAAYALITEPSYEWRLEYGRR